MGIKMTEEELLFIKDKRASGVTYREIAEQLGRHPGSVHKYAQKLGLTKKVVRRGDEMDIPKDQRPARRKAWLEIAWELGV